MEKLGIWVTAELWIAMAMHLCAEESEKVDQDSPKGAVENDVMHVLKLMQSRLRVERVYGPFVKDKPIRVLASVKCNRTVRATRKIKKGEIIFQELPEILEQSIKTHHVTACAECARSLIQPEDMFGNDSIVAPDVKRGLRKIWPKRNVVSCSFCSEVKYCSEECRKRSWGCHHKVICPSNTESTAAMLYDVRRSFSDVMAADGSSWQGWWNTKFSPILLSRMTAIVLCKANLLANLRSRESYTDAHWLMCESVLEKYPSCDKLITADDVPKMQELLNSIFKRSKFLRYDMTKSIFRKRYSQAATNVIQFHDTTHPMNDFASQIKTGKDNKLCKKMKKSYEKSLEKPSLAEFHGLFPLASCLNHSCFPNAVVESSEVEALPGIAVKAVRDIRVGDEIVLSYVEPLVERHERRKLLWREYKFVCECPRCLHEGIGPYVCTNCGKSSKIPKDSSIEEPQQETTGTPGDSTSPTTDAKPPISDSSNYPNSSAQEKDYADFTHKDEKEESNVDVASSTQKENQMSTTVNSDGHINNDVPSYVEDNEKETNLAARNELDSTTNLDCQQVDLATKGIDLATDHELEPKISLGSHQVDLAIKDVSLAPDNESETQTQRVDLAPKDVNLATDNEPETKTNVETQQADLATKQEMKTKGASEHGALKFSVCSRCKKAWYCSLECQKESWTSGHKKICTPR